jgi:hypothetical protein
VATDLREHLEQPLAGIYTVERELGREPRVYPKVSVS